MMRPTTCAPLLAVLAILSGCQSPLVGTWVETSEASPQVEGEADLVVFGADGRTVEYAMRNGRLQGSIPGNYRIKRDILIIKDEPMGCISSEIAQRFTIEGDTLVLDDGTFRTTYQRLRPACLGVAGESGHF